MKWMMHGSLYFPDRIHDAVLKLPNADRFLKDHRQLGPFKPYFPHAKGNKRINHRYTIRGAPDGWRAFWRGYLDLQQTSGLRRRLSGIWLTLDFTPREKRDASHFAIRGARSEGLLPYCRDDPVYVLNPVRDQCPMPHMPPPHLWRKKPIPIDAGDLQRIKSVFAQANQNEWLISERGRSIIEDVSPTAGLFFDLDPRGSDRARTLTVRWRQFGAAELAPPSSTIGWWNEPCAWGEEWASYPLWAQVYALGEVIAYDEPLRGHVLASHELGATREFDQHFQNGYELGTVAPCPVFYVLSHHLVERIGRRELGLHLIPVVRTDQIPARPDPFELGLTDPTLYDPPDAEVEPHPDDVAVGFEEGEWEKLYPDE